MYPSVDEVRKLAATGHYRRIPVKRELYADGFTTIEATRALREASSHVFLFRGVSSPTQVGRYHSLEADPKTLPACLKVTSQNDEGEIMAVQHRDHPTFGVQFHPESILTPEGAAMARNFLRLACG